MNERLNETVRQARQKAVDFWKKYDKKQKTMMISITLVVVVALVILAVALTKPKYKTLITCTDTLAAAEVKAALDGNFEYKVSNGGLTFSVKEKDLNNATYMIAQGGYTADGFQPTSINDALGSGFSTTSEDKQRLYQKYLEDKMKSVLEDLDFVKTASVTFNPPSSQLTVLSKKEETTVAVVLELRKSFPAGAGESMANFIAAAAGNSTTDSVYIMDTKGNTLFQGGSEEMSSMASDESAQIKSMYEEDMIRNITKLVTATKMFNEVAVAPVLEIDWDKVSSTTEAFSNPDNVKYNDYAYEATGVSGSGGVPGTDSNDNDTTYEIQLNGGTQSTVTINKNEYAPTKTITHREGMRGTLQPANSKVSVVLTQYVTYDEDVVRASGELDGMSWEEYQSANSGSREMEVDQSIIDYISGAVNIPAANVTIKAYQVPMFNSSVSESVNFMNYIPVILTVCILAMLGFVVWRSLKPVEVTEVDTGLSVGELLTATEEVQKVEDIDLNDKSDVRKAIEKFVDENPEAVALLLRNWLSDD